MTADYTRRLSFIQALTYADETERINLLRLEETDELARLFEVAMAEGYTGVAASIEVHADGRWEY